MESGKATPINQALFDAKRGSSETQPLLENSVENQSYESTKDDARDVGNTADDQVESTSVAFDFQLQIDKARARYLTVEIPAALVTLVFQMLNTFETEYIHERISADYNYSPIDNTSLCGNSSGNDTEIGAQIQSEVSTWIFYLTLAYALPSLFFTIIFGSISDRYGRRPAMFSSIFGLFLRSVIFLAIVHFHLPIAVSIAADFIGGTLGGNALMMTMATAYITDVTSEKERTLRIVFLEFASFIGIGMGQITLGLTVENSPFESWEKYMLPLYISLGCTVVGLAYVILPKLLIETVDRNAEGDHHGIGMVFTGIVDLVKVNTNGRRLKVVFNCLIMVFAAITLFSQLKLIIVYGLGEPFCLTPLSISFLAAVGISSPVIGMALGGTIFSRFLSDNWILQISLWNNILFMVLVGLAETTLVLYIAAACGLFDALFVPILRSKLSKLSREHERGLMLAFIGCMDSIAYLLTPIIANNIYSATVHFFPPFVFFFLAGFNLIPVVLAGILQYLENKPYSHQEVDDNEKKET